MLTDFNIFKVDKITEIFGIKIKIKIFANENFKSSIINVNHLNKTL